MTTTPDRTTGLLLPGQAASPAGPCDLSGMYLMHHAFRRDLRHFTAAVRATPLDDHTTWSALRERWERMAHLLHEHHSVEDRVLWPLLHERVAAADDAAGRSVLEAMTAEHDLIDPLLERAGAGFVELAAARPGVGSTRDDLATVLEDAAATLDTHLGHEEREAVALMQRYLDGDEWATLERTEFRGKPSLGVLRFQLPWMVHEVPADAVAPLLRQAGLPFRVVLATSRRAFDRQQAAAFRHLPPAA